MIVAVGTKENKPVDAKEFVRSLHREFSNEEVPRQRDGYEIKRIPCCILLRNTEQDRTLKLNDISLLIWELCNGQFCVGEILEMLMDHFPEAASTIRRDVFRVLDELYEEDTITISSS